MVTKLNQTTMKTGLGFGSWRFSYCKNNMPRKRKKDLTVGTRFKYTAQRETNLVDLVGRGNAFLKHQIRHDAWVDCAFRLEKKRNAHKTELTKPQRVQVSFATKVAALHKTL
jgi:hypothetical protein